MNKEILVKLLDRGSRKHSWHLPTYPSGHINWYADETLETILGQIRAAREEAAYLLGLANDAYLEVEPIVTQLTTCCVTGKRVEEGFLTVQCLFCNGYVSEGYYVTDKEGYVLCDNCMEADYD